MKIEDKEIDGPQLYEQILFAMYDTGGGSTAEIATVVFNRFCRENLIRKQLHSEPREVQLQVVSEVLQCLHVMKTEGLLSGGEDGAPDAN